MAIFKCKMCGGTIEFEPGATVGVCDSCGTKQTLPRLDDDRRANLYDRANHFRRNNEFDKAAGIYEQILTEDTTDAEAYWSLVLCRYGIEYVEDPVTRKRVPTVNRAQFTSVFDDDNYKSALQYADGFQRSIYQEEAAAINEIQKGILAISQKEEPFDVFICYKETDSSGRRTRDSVLANDLYHQLTQEGFKVFFSRITLEDKLGTAYEPYIFAALNSAKVMVVLGTKPEYFNAVWVKNEWSRYLALVRQSGGKKVLIPAYRDMDPYDLPEEFSHLQAQDMSKLGFMQDLIRGIRKIVKTDEAKPAQRPAPQAVRETGGPSTANLLRRGNLFLEEGDWASAEEYFNKVLDLEAENGAAYLGLAIAKANALDLKSFMLYQTVIHETKPQLLQACEPARERIRAIAKRLAVPGYLDEATICAPFEYSLTYPSKEAAEQANIDIIRDDLERNRDYSRAKQYADAELKATIERAEAELYKNMDLLVQSAHINAEAEKEETIQRYEAHLEACEKKAEAMSQQARKEREDDYQKACMIQQAAKTADEFSFAASQFQNLAGYQDAAQREQDCCSEAKRLTEQAKRDAERRAKKRKKIALITVLAAALAAAAVIVIIKVIIPNSKYNEAVKLYEAGKYEEAIVAFEALDGHKDSEEQIKLCEYDLAIQLFEAGEYEEAIAAFEALDGYKDSAAQITKCETAIKDQKYNAAIELYNTGKYDEAITAFEALNGYKDSETQLEKCYIGKYGEEKYNLIKNIKVGDTYKFGSYEQDNETSNGKEEIEWIVLDKDGMSLLLISKYALDCRQYNTSHTYVMWQTCSLREWLNGTFLRAAFSSEEQNSIISSKVYLLSINEVNKYFNSDSARQCQGTAYCYAQGAYKASNGNCWWWLESPADYYAAGVDEDGSVPDYGRPVDSRYGAVRPALWINLGSLIF